MPTAGSGCGSLSPALPSGETVRGSPEPASLQTGVHTHAHGLFQSPQAAR